MTTHSGIRDSGAMLQIIPSTRKISVPTNCKVIGTVGDINSEQVRFQCPKEIDGHDIEGCNQHYVTWENANGDIGIDHLEFLSKDDENLYFGWIVRGELTTKAGIVSFSIRFEDISESGRTVYSWGTTECRDCKILDTVNASVGAFANVYVDGHTLVFADHTPVYDGQTLVLETPGIVPNGRKTINTNGVHDVVGFASVDVMVPRDNAITLELQDGGVMVATDGSTTVTKQLETPKIKFSTGTVTASANGLTAAETIHTAQLCKRTVVNISHSAGGKVITQDIEYGTNAMIKRTTTFTPESDVPYELRLIAGSYLYFDQVNKSSDVKVNGVSVTDEIKVNGVSYKYIIVPDVADGTVVNIVMN